MAAALILLHAATSFVTLSQTLYGADLASARALQHGNFTGAATATLGFLWTLPELATDTNGLGGGIAWAWDDALCPALTPLLKEDLFFAPLVECHHLKAAMHRAFESWASNHRFISFVDVSEECRQRHGEVTEDCELVEVWVTSRDKADPALFSEAARAEPLGRTTSDFRYTSGARPLRWSAAAQALEPRAVVETHRGTISFTGERADAEPLCWYLDSTFCANFHTLKSLPGMTPDGVRTYGLAIVGVLTAISLLTTLTQLVSVCRTLKGPFAARAAMLADALAKWSVCCTALRFVLAITPTLFYRQIFLPCFNCYDFEASAIHEIGPPDFDRASRL